MLFPNCDSELLFPNELQQIRMPLYEVLHVVCETANSEITVEMFSAAFRCRQSIFDLGTISSRGFCQVGGWALKTLSLFFLF